MLRRMELRHFRYFLAVAEERHITRAARRLGMQQPPLSQQIRALEAEIGVALFTRLPRGVALTAAGTAFLAEARRVLAGAEQAASRAVLAARGQEGEIAIGFTTSALLHPLVTAITGAYAARYRNVTLTLQEGNAADLTDQLAAGSLHAAFLRAVVSRPLGVDFTELLAEDMLLAVPSGHRLARRRPAQVAIADLAAERFILVRRHAAPGMYADVVEECRAAGFEPIIAAEVGRMLSNIKLVAAGVGISVVPASMREIRLDGVRYLRLAAAERLRAPLTIAARSDEARPTVANLLAITEEHAGGRHVSGKDSTPVKAKRSARQRGEEVKAR
jgi:DNA-binding transcriptional LysR family regulator